LESLLYINDTNDIVGLTWPILPRGTDMAYLLLYINDIVSAASSMGLLQRIISALQ
jgi:hypothetical protein